LNDSSAAQGSAIMKEKHVIGKDDGEDRKFQERTKTKQNNKILRFASKDSLDAKRPTKI